MSAPSLSAEAPSLWIIGGPNGSGKTSVYSEAAIEGPLGSVWIINPDKLSKTIAEHEELAPSDANLEAVKRIETWLYASVLTHQTVGVETVLSTGKFRKLVEEAKGRGFKIRLVYVFLRDVEQNVERVRLRVAKGGHDVPEDKIRDRRDRSFRQLSWFFIQADQAVIYDNSGATPRLVVEKREDGVVETRSDLIPEIDAVISDYVATFR